jgi:hypothetical protein
MPARDRVAAVADSAINPLDRGAPITPVTVECDPADGGSKFREQVYGAQTAGAATATGDAIKTASNACAAELKLES